MAMRMHRRDRGLVRDEDRNAIAAAARSDATLGFDPSAPMPNRRSAQ
jgi:hypothetical protein